MWSPGQWDDDVTPGPKSKLNIDFLSARITTDVSAGAGWLAGCNTFLTSVYSAECTQIADQSQAEPSGGYNIYTTWPIYWADTEPTRPCQWEDCIHQIIRASFARRWWETPVSYLQLVYIISDLRSQQIRQMFPHGWSHHSARYYVGMLYLGAERRPF